MGGDSPKWVPGTPRQLGVRDCDFACDDSLNGMSSRTGGSTMIKRTLLLLLALTLLLALAAGCSPGSTDTTKPEATEDAASTGGDSTGTEAEPAEAAAPAKLAPETDGEKTAASQAQSEEARKWASGDSINGAPVAGEPFLAGYGVLVHDGSKQYQVSVFDGVVLGFFGKSADLRYVEAQFQGYNPTIAPSSARQTEAFEAAKAEVASINPNATQGGIEYYIFLYPQVDEAQYPQVCIYTSPTLADSPWAMGGAYGWR